MSPYCYSSGEPENKASPDLYSALVLTRGALEQGLPRDCTLYRGSPKEPGNEASPGRVLSTGAHQGSQGMRLAMSLHSVLVLTKRAWEQG